MPFELWSKYNRKRIRIKVYDDINSYSGEMTQEEYADFRADVYTYLLSQNRYNPFQEELSRSRELQHTKTVLVEKLETVEAMTVEEIRQASPIDKALIFISKAEYLENLQKLRSPAIEVQLTGLYRG